jgi:ubiquinone/menaquinone biosynthesis C-methylase UbiE
MKLDDVRKTFTDWAPIYDATHGWLPKRREARLALDVQPGDRVLDLACGTGLNFAHLSELVGAEGHVTGVDLTPAMLDSARAQIDRHGWRNVEVREADAANLPFPDASFDKVICVFSLNIIPNYVRAIEEVKRVLMPGGRFVSLEMQAMMHNLPSWLQPIPHICAVDLGHRTLDELRRVFPNVRVQKYWLGMMFVAAATKE